MEKFAKLMILGNVLLMFMYIIFNSLSSNILMTVKRHPLHHTNRVTYHKRSKMTLAELMKIPDANIVGTFRFTPQKRRINETIPKLSSSYRKQHGLPESMSCINDDYGTRMHRLQSFCASNKERNSQLCKKDSHNCTYERIFVDENHKVIFCAIPKVASTAWMMKLLEMAHKPYNSHIVKAWTALGELGIRSLDEYSMEEREDRLKNYFKFMFVRHPLTRLVSAYREKILTKRLTKILQPRVKEFLNKTTDGDITFDEFTSYLTMSKGDLVDNKHWQTYGRLCRLCDISYNFIGRQEFLSKDAKYLFKTQFRHVRLADQAGADFGNNVHRTNSDLETTQGYFSLLRTETKDAVVRRYGDDMEMFGYKKSDIY